MEVISDDGIVCADEFTFALDLPRQEQDFEMLYEAFTASRRFEAGQLARFGYLGGAYIVHIARDGKRVEITLQAD